MEWSDKERLLVISKITASTGNDKLMNLRELHHRNQTINVIATASKELLNANMQNFADDWLPGGE